LRFATLSFGFLAGTIAPMNSRSAMRF